VGYKPPPLKTYSKHKISNKRVSTMTVWSSASLIYQTGTGLYGPGYRRFCNRRKQISVKHVEIPDTALSQKHQLQKVSLPLYAVRQFSTCQGSVEYCFHHCLFCQCRPVTAAHVRYYLPDHLLSVLKTGLSFPSCWSEASVDIQRQFTEQTLTNDHTKQHKAKCFS
jgi:hypothetical protein